jgi:hypothetical protein
MEFHLDLPPKSANVSTFCVPPSLDRSTSAQMYPFISVNCGTATETLPDPELFGHERGAFRGANEERKRFERSRDRGVSIEQDSIVTNSSFSFDTLFLVSLLYRH